MFGWDIWSCSLPPASLAARQAQENDRSKEAQAARDRTKLRVQAYCRLCRQVKKAIKAGERSFRTIELSSFPELIETLTNQGYKVEELPRPQYKHIAVLRNVSRRTRTFQVTF